MLETIKNGSYRSHHIVHLLVHSYHTQFNHMHHHTLMKEIRQRFAIPKTRIVLKYIRKNGNIRKNLNAVPTPLKMSKLPIERLSPVTRPFTFVRLDFLVQWKLPMLVSVKSNAEPYLLACPSELSILKWLIVCHQTHVSWLFATLWHVAVSHRNFCVIEKKNY